MPSLKKMEKCKFKNIKFLAGDLQRQILVDKFSKLTREQLEQVKKDLEEIREQVAEKEQFWLAGTDWNCKVIVAIDTILLAEASLITFFSIVKVEPMASLVACVVLPLFVGPAVALKFVHKAEDTAERYSAFATKIDGVIKTLDKFMEKDKAVLSRNGR